jgi:hypothetical protein
VVISLLQETGNGSLQLESVSLLLLRAAAFFAFFTLALVMTAGVAFFGALAAGQAFLACLMVREGGLWEGSEGDCGEDQLECFHVRVGIALFYRRARRRTVLRCNRSVIAAVASLELRDTLETAKMRSPSVKSVRRCADLSDLFICVFVVLCIECRTPFGRVLFRFSAQKSLDGVGLSLRSFAPSGHPFPLFEPILHCDEHAAFCFQCSF